MKEKKNKRLTEEQKRARLLRRRKQTRNRVIRRIALCIVTAVLVVVVGLLAVCYTVFYGPSQTASDALTQTLTETSALKFVPRIFFSDEQMQKITERNGLITPDSVTDTSLVVISKPSDKTDGVSSDAPSQSEEKDIELKYVTGSTYKGYMLIVRDPSRVSVGVCNNPFSGHYGKYINEIVEDYGAVAAINGGAFEDEGGTGGGGIPVGIVYSDGEMLWSKTHSYYDTLVGFDHEDKLIVATGYSADQAKKLNLRDAVTFGPALIVNGQAAVSKGTSSGLNPRTAIGQRADGAVLMLVIDGRQVNSLGATLNDLIDVMLEYGAVNAANLDGGSSSKLYLNGEFINDGVALTGSRRMATTFIVR
ncbi:MAG: phosphodiester glycosidase family protein [Clostridia bacterium]|nr:phosphodiester glycosidase family protein [Clostridia bacterium]